VGGVPDVVEDGQSGLLVAMDDAAGMAEALGRLARDRTLGDALGAQGQTRVLERYDAGRLLNDVDALYLSLLRRAGVTP
jgi:glycosyltransferase involved in cell wall biosynthesis